MITSPIMLAVEPVKVMTDTSKIVCVYYGGAHLFEDCYASLVSFNYVGNNKYSNPNNNTYNSGWCNHPKFS